MPSVPSLEMFTRIGFAARGVMYVLIGYLALRFGRSEGGSGALSYIAEGSGRILLAVMAIGFLSYGVWRLSEALVDTEGHGRELKGIAVRAGGAVSGLIHVGQRATHLPWVMWLGRAGYAARAIMFAIVGWFVLQAGLSSDAADAGGMEQALGSLSARLLSAVALGLFLFGLFSFVEARYRRISNPDVLARLKKGAAAA